ncbi:MAG: cache domain-containing protein [Helicobacteraceae bacterium]|jgi:hypothetical protein|nr:cache domain-containing protein [Helicobacteraceae bacterium]
MINSSTFPFRLIAAIVFLFGAAFVMAFYSVQRQFESAQYALEAKADEMRHWLSSYQALLASIADLPVMQSGRDDEIAEFMRTYDKTNLPNIEQFIFVNSRGIGYYADGSVQPLADRIYYKVIVIDQIVEQMITNPYTMQSADAPLIGIVRAVKDKDNGVRGTLYLSIGTDALGEHMRQFNFFKGSKMWLFDRTGRMFAHSHDPRYLMKFALQRSDEYGYKGLRENAERILEHRVGNAVYYDSEGVKRVAFFTPVPNSLGWILSLSVPYANFTKTYFVYGAIMALAMLGLILTFGAIHLIAKARERGKNSDA